jgi:hypothetical protein
MKRMMSSKSEARKKAKTALARSFRVPRGKKKLFVIEAAVEVTSKEELDQVTEAISRVLCPVPPEQDHRCARRWMVITHPADKLEATSWEPILNDR